VYTFNLFNQLIAVRSYQANLQEILLESWEYGYDALNRRIFKTYTNHYTHTDPAYKESFSHHYLYHNEAIIAILDEEQNILATLTHADTIDTPLSITNELTAQTYYYHTDHQGSITHLSNENGEIVESFTYDNSYGTITSHEQTEETYNPYCYTGREFDMNDAPSTGDGNALGVLYYYRARYYDPTVGRFISQDPIEFLSRDFNWYRYVSNNPVNWTDPSGLIVESVDNDVTTPPETPDFRPQIEIDTDNFMNEPGLIDNTDIFFPWTRMVKPLEGLAKGGGVVVVEGGGDVVKTVEKGPYSHLKDPKSVGEGKDFTAAQKKKIYEENKKRNNGILRDDETGEALVPSKKSQKGVKPPQNEAQVDHIIPKKPRTPEQKPGTNSYSNAQVLSRKNNREKSNK